MASPDPLMSTIFAGLDAPDDADVGKKAILSSRVFIQQLALADRVFAMAYKDQSQTCDNAETPEEMNANWRALSTALYDLGFELPDEQLFSILSGSMQAAAALSSDIQRIRDMKAAAAQVNSNGTITGANGANGGGNTGTGSPKSPGNAADELGAALGSGPVPNYSMASSQMQPCARATFSSLVQIGPEVPVPQRVHPFLGTTAVPAKGHHPSLGGGPSPTGLPRGSSLVAGIGGQPTRIFLQDPQRFQKKRQVNIDQLERLRAKFAKAQRAKEKKERELLSKATEAEKQQQLAVHQQETEKKLVSAAAARSDEDVEARRRRTELLRELERLEATANAEQRKIHRLQQERSIASSVFASPSGVLLPRGLAGQSTSASFIQGTVSPQRTAGPPPGAPSPQRGATNRGGPPLTGATGRGGRGGPAAGGAAVFASPPVLQPLVNAPGQSSGSFAQSQSQRHQRAVQPTTGESSNPGHAAKTEQQPACGQSSSPPPNGSPTPTGASPVEPQSVSSVDTTNRRDTQPVNSASVSFVESTGDNGRRENQDAAENSAREATKGTEPNGARSGQGDADSDVVSEKEPLSDADRSQDVAPAEDGDEAKEEEAVPDPNAHGPSSEEAPAAQGSNAEGAQDTDEDGNPGQVDENSTFRTEGTPEESAPVEGSKQRKATVKVLRSESSIPFSQKKGTAK